ncbi:MAG: hypothetical protein IJY39_01260 [Clostridia bacterium]|nr:hypothetical protein [Clostridia bacterium]
MKSKRLIAIFLLLAMLPTMLLACGGEQTETDAGTLEETEKVTETQKQTEATEESTTETETETEEETIVITDVMIGETLEAEYAADFTVSRVFANDMVVQRGEHIRVWGFAPASENGKKVSGEFKGMFAEAIIENGEWCLTFGARLEADVNGAEMKIYTNKKEVVFKDVLVGDVYMVIGQSNVEYSVSSHIANTNAATQGGGQAAISSDSIIRLLRNNNASGGNFPAAGTTEVCKDLRATKSWTKTTLQDTLSFSAIGYYFATQMVEKTDSKIPVGVIEVGFSGAPIGMFLPNEVADALGTDTYNKETGLYTTTGVNAHEGSGRYLYNRHIYPFERYAIAGIVWYQGCSNNSLEEAMKYNQTFTALMEYMRSTHNLCKKEFPVFVVELPTIYKKPADFTGTWHFMELGVIRSYMGSIPMMLDNCYVSASSDLWADKSFFNSLHPNCKFEQADRLSDIAASVVCGQGALSDAMGPVLKQIEISEDGLSATLTFENVGDGLKTSDGGKAVKGLTVFLGDEYSLKAEAPESVEITAKDQITVTHSKKISGVAYNYESEDFYGDTLNLCNSAGCPASAFNTGFTTKDPGTFTADSFIKDTDKSVGKKGKAIDYLRADGVDLFPIGGIEAKLSAAGNQITVSQGTVSLNMYGWVGFKYEIDLFGYSIDDGNAVFNAYPGAAQQAVLDAGGKYAKRFTVNVDISELSVGKHTVTLLALVNAEGGKAVKLLSFNVIVEEPTAEEPETEEETSAPADNPTVENGSFIEYTDSKAGLVGHAIDALILDGAHYFEVGGIRNKLTAANNTVTVSRSAKILLPYGWAGFKSEIVSFGYSIDDNEPILTSAPVACEDAVKAAGGEHAKRFSVNIDLSAISTGEHTVNLLVHLNQDGGTLVRIISFKLIINE